MNREEFDKASERVTVEVVEALAKGRREAAFDILEGFVKDALGTGLDRNAARQWFEEASATINAQASEGFSRDDLEVIFEEAEMRHSVSQERNDHSKRLLSSLARLRDHAKKARATPWEDLEEVETESGTVIKSILLSKIQTMEDQFQPRTFEGQRAERFQVIKELANAISNVGIENIEPTVIWWSGQEWFVVDGHHRMEAIKKWNFDARKKGSRKRITRIPVVVREGDLSEALRATTEENGKVRLTLPLKQRMDRAWRTLVLHKSGLIGDGRFILKDWHKVLHVGLRSLENMNAVWKKLRREIEDDLGRPLRVPQDAKHVTRVASMTWHHAEQKSRGATEEEIDWEVKRTAIIQDFAERLMKVFPKDAFGAGKAEFFGEALLEISSTFLNHANGSEVFADANRKALRVIYGEFDEDEAEGDDENPEALPKPAY